MEEQERLEKMLGYMQQTDCAVPRVCINAYQIVVEQLRLKEPKQALIYQKKLNEIFRYKK